MAANDDRRQFIRLGAAGVASLLVAGALTRHSVLAQSSLSQGVQALPFDLEKNPQTVEPLNIDNKEWRKYLSDFEYYVLREEGTERAFTSPLNDEKRQGEFVCAGCGLLLFTSETKYDSGTGWPSFYDGITKNIGTSIDYKLFYPRTEYHCKRCGGHQGHVFKDGPQPTGLRYCNNGVALRFIPA